MIEGEKTCNDSESGDTVVARRWEEERDRGQDRIISSIGDRLRKKRQKEREQQPRERRDLTAPRQLTPTALGLAGSVKRCRLACRYLLETYVVVVAVVDVARVVVSFPQVTQAPASSSD